MGFFCFLLCFVTYHFVNYGSEFIRFSFLIDLYDLHAPEHLVLLQLLSTSCGQFETFALLDQTRHFKMASIVCICCFKIYVGDANLPPRSCCVSRLLSQTRGGIGFAPRSVAGTLSAYFSVCTLRSLRCSSLRVVLCGGDRTIEVVRLVRNSWPEMCFLCRSMSCVSSCVCKCLCEAGVCIKMSRGSQSTGPIPHRYFLTGWHPSRVVQRAC